MKDKKPFERFGLAMAARGLTQNDIAEELSIGQSMVSQYLNGKKSLSEKQLNRFAKLLDIDSNWLINGDPPVPDILLDFGFNSPVVVSLSHTSYSLPSISS